MNKRLLIAGGILLIALAMRMWGISQPRQVVFDEVHFGKFITAYCCSHERVFDIHPPHAKILIAGAARLLGYTGGFDFDHIGQVYDTGVSVVALRFLPALAGAFIPFLIYILLRQLGVSYLLSVLGALVFVFDNAFILQSRLISLDTILIAATLGTITSYLAAQKSQDAPGRYGFLIIAGALAGLALGTKFTGLAAGGVVGVLMAGRYLWYPTRQSMLRLVQEGLVLLVSALVIYGGGWVAHYVILTQPGTGDVWQSPSGSILTDIIDMHQVMFDANYNLTASHPYSSAWWSWPIMQRPVFYWQASGNHFLYFLGNPLVWWGGTILFVTTLFSIVSRRSRMNKALAILITGYVISFLPFIGVPRALFLYHYMTPLLFSVLVGIVWLDQVLQRDGTKRKVVIGTSVAVIGLFVLFSPLTYGFATDAWYTYLFWLPSWR
ncbi:MAG: phospholipid carrier-dependent glycosyltransferase [Candidatus Andersenbacteria bacterium]